MDHSAADTVLVTAREVRAKTGCRGCREARVKCDEVRPICSRCCRRRMECSYPNAPSAASSSLAVTPSRFRARKRSTLACAPCRRRKIRCEGPGDEELLNAVCARCRRLTLSCRWAAREHVVPQNSHQSPSILASTDQELNSSNVLSSITDAEDTIISGTTPAQPNGPSSLETLLQNKAKTHGLIRTYFGTVHQFGFLAFIHEPSYCRLFDRSKAPRELTSLMLACTLRFACHEPTPAGLAQADSLYMDALHNLRERMCNRFGAVELMAVLLARLYENAKGNVASACMLWGEAAKMSQFLSLHTFDETYLEGQYTPSNPLLSREALRRVAWAVFYLDTIADGGRYGSHSIEEDSLSIGVPCNEESFIRGTEVITPKLQKGNTSRSGPTFSSIHSDFSSLGSSAHLIQTAAVRRRILHFNSRLRQSLDSPTNLLASLSVLENDLREVIASLPQCFAYTEGNLFFNGERRTSFILLHTLRHNCFIILAQTRINICRHHPGFEEERKTSMHERIRHALPTAGIIADGVRMGIICDPFVAMMAYMAIEILLTDPQYLARYDPTFDPFATVYPKAISPLLDLLRKIARVDESIAHLHAEASVRLASCGLSDIMQAVDLEAAQRASARFALDVSRNHGESSVPHIRLDPRDRPNSAPTSRTASPEPHAVDAGTLVPPSTTSSQSTRQSSDLGAYWDTMASADEAMRFLGSVQRSMFDLQPTPTLDIDAAGVGIIASNPSNQGLALTINDDDFWGLLDPSSQNALTNPLGS